MSIRKSLALLFFLVGTTNAMNQPVPKIDLNQIHSYLETYTGAANLVKAYPSLQDMDRQEHNYSWACAWRMVSR